MCYYNNGCHLRVLARCRAAHCAVACGECSLLSAVGYAST